MNRFLTYLFKYLLPALLILLTTYSLIQVSISTLYNEKKNKLQSLAMVLEHRIQEQPDLYTAFQKDNRDELEQKVQPMLDELNFQNSNLGASVYVPRLQQFVGFAPRSALETDITSKLPPEDLQEVYHSQEPLYDSVYSYLQNETAFNYCIPIRIDGKVVAVLNINQSLATVSGEIRMIWLSGLAVCLVALLFLAVAALSESRQTKRLQQEQAQLVRWIQSFPIHDFDPDTLNSEFTLLNRLPTEFRKAIELIHFERQQKQHVLNQLPMGILIFNQQGQIIYCNPFFVQLLGYSQEELFKWTDQKWLEHYRLLDGGNIHEILAQGGSLENHLGVLFNKDGAEIPFAVTTRVLPAYAGQPMGYLLYLHDLSYEFAFDRLAQKSYHLFNSMSLNVIVVDCHLEIEYINPAVCRMFGKGEPELLGRQLNDLLALDENAGLPNLNLVAKIRRVLETKKRVHLTKLKSIILGREYDLELDLFPIINPYTEVADGCMLVIKDMTLYREWEELSQRVDAHSNYVQMAATIAHEVRNPMTSVRGFLQLLGADIQNGQHRMYIDVMQTEIDRMNSILSEYLSMARPLHVGKVQINLSELVHDTILLLEGEANYRGIEMVQALAPDCWIEGVARELKQVLINLVRNAFDAVENNHGRITVRLDSLPDGTRIEIEDNGCGIAEDQWQRIFDPFYTTKAVGTGLGLPVCKKFIESHGGTLQVRSQLNVGTTFVIELPKPMPEQ